MSNIYKSILCRLVMVPVYCLCILYQEPVFAQNKALKVTLRVKRQPASSVLSLIEQQTGLSPMYSDTMAYRLSKLVDIKVVNAPVENVLRKLLAPLGCTFEISDMSILVMKDTQAAAGRTARPDMPAASHQLAGTVTNKEGHPIGGVNVMIKGTFVQTVTDAEGRFWFQRIKAQDRLLVYGSGYESKEMPAGGKDEVDVVLNAAVNNLGETVVIGYSPPSRRFSTDNTAILTAADIAGQPVSNPLQALEGWIPGLFIEQATGLPGTGMKVRIQGQNSIAETGDPLYIVDGVPFLSQLPFTYSNIQGGSGSNGVNLAGVPPGSGSTLEYINPADIDSIAVLKDADAAAQYGSRAGNGAIVITTKKGPDSAFRFHITCEEGRGAVVRKIPLLSTTPYLGLRATAYRNDGLPVPDRSSVVQQTNLDLTHYDPSRSTDWQEELIGGTAQYRNLYANISGRKGNTRYFAGMGYHKQTTVFPEELGDHKRSMHMSILRGSGNRRFRVAFNGNYMYGNTLLVADDLTKDAISLAPNAPALYKPDGNLNWDMLPDGSAGWNNPLARSQPYRNITANLLTGLTVGYRLFSGLQLNSIFGYNYLHAHDELWQPLSTYTPQERMSRLNSMQVAVAQMHTWTAEPRLTYNKDFRNATYSVTIGYTLQEHAARRNAVDGSGFETEQQMKDIAFATYKDTANSSAYYRFSAVYGIFSGNWYNRYLLTFSVRQDHSSRLGKTERSHTFGTLALAWIFSDEQYIKEQLPFLSFGKLRAGYCLTGNDGVQETDVNTYNTLLNRPPAPRWEMISKTYLGMELGLAQNKVFLGINYYYNRSTNQLIEFREASIMSFRSGVYRYGALVQNTGWEMELHTQKIALGQCRWRADATLTIPRNKLLSFPGLEQTSYANDYVAGQSLNLVRVYQFAGIDPQTGLNQITDRNGNIQPPGAVGQPEDRVINIDLNPRFYGLLHNCFTYGGFQLDVSFQFVKQKGPLYNWSNQPGLFNSIANTGNQPAAVLAAWQKPGDNAAIAKASSYLSETTYASYINGQFSSAMFGDASYIRLRNLALSYQLPAMKWRHATAKIFAHAQNLLTITGYNGLDPETKSSVSLPPLRVITVGATVTI